MPERVAHPGGQLRDGFADNRGVDRLEPQVAPVRVLPRGQGAGQRVGVAAVRVVDLRGADVVDRQDEVIAVELALPVQELPDLGAAVRAAEEDRGNDGQQ